MSISPARVVVRVGIVVVVAIACSVLIQKLAGAPALSPWIYAVLAGILVGTQWVLARQKSGGR